MTQTTQTSPSAERAPAPERASRRRTPWWRRPWIIPLTLVVIWFLHHQISPFVGVSEKQAPIPPHKGFSAYYPLLWTHMIAGSIAMGTVILQVWPWLRRRYPAVHRVSGRLYVVAALVGGVCGLVIVRFAPPVGQIGVSAATVVWMTTAVAGLVAVRRGRYALHRRLMLYSFAVVMNNVWGVLIVEVLSRFPGVAVTYYLEAARWVGWVLNLMLVQWWLDRTADRPVEGPVAKPATGGAAREAARA